MSRLLTHEKMVRWIRETGKDIVGIRFFEVGTGHVPVAPIGAFLCGARSVVTVDLHRRIDWGLTRKSLEWMVNHRDAVFGVYRDDLDERLFNEHFAILTRFKHNPAALFREVGIQYLAPMDATNTRLPDNSIDCHFSITVLEHIPLSVVRNILLEARRLLKPSGFAIHFVDMSDHFQHTDHTITRINFLRYSENEWQRMAGNEFAYCNRLRASDYLQIFTDLDFAIARHETLVDPEAMRIVRKCKIPLHSHYADYTLEDICSTSLMVLLR